MRSFIVVILLLVSVSAQAGDGAIWVGMGWTGSRFRVASGDNDEEVRSKLRSIQLVNTSRNGVCVGGLSRYYGGGRFNIGVACADDYKTAYEAAAETCVSRSPYLRCDYSTTSVSADEFR